MAPKAGRVNKEFANVQAKNYEGVTVSYFDDSDVFKWKVVITGTNEF